MGNPQHFLVQGERGIGKSSLLFYVDHLARGNLKPFKGERRYNFLVINIDLGSCQSSLDIVRRIARGFRIALSNDEALKTSAKGIWDWLTNWEVLGVRYHKPTSDLDMEEIIDDLVERMGAFCNQMQGQKDGILVLMDEADRPNADARLGELMKLMTERLTRTQCNNVLFGLAGLPSIVQKLRDSHESSPRIFHTFMLDPLNEDERELALEIGLEEANDKNDVKTTMTESAGEFLGLLSEGYPHFIQQFAYCAFDHDTDDEIDEADVGHSAFKPGGALNQLGDKYFNDMYHMRISSDDYRKVLNTMAGHGDIWVSRKDIISQSGLSKTTVANALNALRSRNIILYDESRNRQGFYRLPNRSFATWINAFRSIQQRPDLANDDEIVSGD